MPPRMTRVLGVAPSSVLAGLAPLLRNVVGQGGFGGAAFKGPSKEAAFYPMDWRAPDGRGTGAQG
jgi:hypothetical protein